jgi:hypothetical protein
MSDITAVVLSIGEATTLRAIASVSRQTLPAKEIVTIRNVSPFYKAMNVGASKVKTEFFVQVDSDMILDENCFEDLRSCMREEIGLALGLLRDPLMGRVGWVKMFRAEIFNTVQYKDLVSQDLVFKDDISKVGWNTAVAIRPLSNISRDLWHTFGEHRPAYTPHYTYSKYLVEGRKYRYRKALVPMQWHIKMLSRSTHPMALIAEIALAHGIFIREEHDLLQPYSRNEDFEFLESFFQSTGSYDVSRISVVPLLNSRPEKTFEKNYRLGISLRQANAFPAFTRCMEWLKASHDPLAWLAKIGLCHGLFADAYHRQTCAAEYALLRELLPSDAAYPVLKARLRMFYQCHIRSHVLLVSRLHADRR